MLNFLIAAYFPNVSTVFMKILFPVKVTGYSSHVFVFSIIYGLWQELIKH